MTLFFKIGKVIKVKRVNEIWVRMSITNIYLHQFNFIELFVKKHGTSGLIPKRDRLKVLVVHLLIELSSSRG